MTDFTTGLEERRLVKKELPGLEAGFGGPAFSECLLLNTRLIELQSRIVFIEHIDRVMSTKQQCLYITSSLIIYNLFPNKYKYT